MDREQKIFKYILIILLVIIIIQLWHISKTLDYVDWDVRNILGKINFKQDFLFNKYGRNNQKRVRQASLHTHVRLAFCSGFTMFFFRSFKFNELVRSLPEGECTALDIFAYWNADSRPVGNSAMSLSMVDLRVLPCLNCLSLLIAVVFVLHFSQQTNFRGLLGLVALFLPSWCSDNLFLRLLVQPQYRLLSAH